MAKDILLLDNYDSFTYNLYHYLEELNEGNITVMRNDEINYEAVNRFEKVVISPGPGLPEQAGELMPFLERFATTKELLGICLGQQAIAAHFGMKLINLNEVVHGQSKELVLNSNDKLFHRIPKKIKVGRYHSWVIDPKSLTNDFLVSSSDEEGNIMSIAHKELPIRAVQFHPESILTEYGKEMLRNWLST